MANQSEKGPAKKAGSAVNKARDMAKEKKILKYLKHQLKIKEDELKYYETPIDPEVLKDIRKMEEVILRNKVSQLRELINSIEYIIEEEED